MILGRPRWSWVHDIGMDLKEIGVNTIIVWVYMRIY